MPDILDRSPAQRTRPGVYLQQVVAVSAHPDADRLEIVVLRSGERCVVGKGEHGVGDEVLLLGVGAQLPPRLISRLGLPESRLGRDATGARTIVCRSVLRGEVSEGLAVSAQQCGFASVPPLRGIDYASKLGISFPQPSRRAALAVRRHTPTVRADSNVGRYLTEHADCVPEDARARSVERLPEHLRALPVFTLAASVPEANDEPPCWLSRKTARDVLDADDVIGATVISGVGASALVIAVFSLLGVNPSPALMTLSIVACAVLGMVLLLRQQVNRVQRAGGSQAPVSDSLLDRFDVEALAEGDKTVLRLRRWFHRPEDGWQVAPLYQRVFAGCDLQAAAAAKVELQQQARCLTLATIADDRQLRVADEALADPEEIEAALRSHVAHAQFRLQQLTDEAQVRLQAEQEARETAAILQAQIEREQHLLARG